MRDLLAQHTRGIPSGPELSVVLDDGLPGRAGEEDDITMLFYPPFATSAGSAHLIPWTIGVPVHHFAPALGLST
jgi:hypothetical protein